MYVIKYGRTNNLSEHTHTHTDIEFFSAERKCPNKDFGIPGCSDTNPWNPYTNVSSVILLCKHLHCIYIVHVHVHMHALFNFGSM